LSVTFPQGVFDEVSAEIDAALQDEPDSSAPEDEAEVAEPEVVEETPDAAEPEAEPAAEAGESDFEERYRERFEDEYRDRSRKDIARVQSTLNKQTHQEKQGRELAVLAHRESEQFIEALLAELQDYDPDQVTKLKQGRSLVIRDEQAKHATRQQARTQLEERRGAFYAESFPSLDPDDPDLRAAFERGDNDAEKRAVERLLKLERLEAAARPKPQAKVAVAEVPEVPPEPAPVRDASGKFVAKQVAATQAREQARGTIPATAGAGNVPTPVPQDREARARYFASEITKLTGLR